MRFGYPELFWTAVILYTSCASQTFVNYDIIQSLEPAKGSILTGYSREALNNATKLSDVRNQCGVPTAEWDEDMALFGKVKVLRYNTHDVHGNPLIVSLKFAVVGYDPPLISVEYNQPQS